MSGPSTRVGGGLALHPAHPAVRNRFLPVLAVGTVATALLTGCVGPAGPGGPTGTAGPGVTSSSTSSPSSTSSSPPASPTGSSSSSSSSVAQPSLPSHLLGAWPFTGPSQVRAWQQAYRSNGSQPWHLSATDTALGFTRGFLGYTEIDRVLSVKTDGDQAVVAVGWSGEGGQHVAALLHLARYGSGASGPWEVVGSNDTDLSLSKPGYGSQVTSPVLVGGRVSGVDENLQVIARSAAGGQPVGSAPGVPAGGSATPWSTTLPVSAHPGELVTLAVSTGGHIKQVERFAITVVRFAGRAVADDVSWGTANVSVGRLSSAPLVGVRAGRHVDFDRLAFDISGTAGGYRVGYVDVVRAEGSGAAVAVTGRARLQVTLLDPTHDPERLVTWYVPADRQHVVDVTGYPAINQVVWAGSFEGHTSVGVGLSQRLPFRSFVLQPRPGLSILVLDVAHPG